MSCAKYAFERDSGMTRSHVSRRNFLQTAGALVGSSLLHSPRTLFGQSAASQSLEGKADYALKIATTPLELAPNRIVSVTTYNGQFPGPLLRMKEGRRVMVDVQNETDVPEQLHWHPAFFSREIHRNRPKLSSRAWPWMPISKSKAAIICVAD